MNNYKNLLELLSGYASSNSQTFIWYDAKGIRKLEDAGNVDKLNEIYAFYREFLPEGVYAEFFNSSYGAFEYSDTLSAQDEAEDWFPRPAQLPDSDYYVYCCVFNQVGALEWENVDLPTPPTQTEETE